MECGIRVIRDWVDVEGQALEVVERKGLGHPDTLADGVAEAISVAYSRECLQRFGAVLHHNLDKVYIGGGHFVPSFGGYDFRQPVRVVVNGRMSSSFGGDDLDIAALQEDAARAYVGRILPHLDTEKHLSVAPNATQHTKRPFWFTPRGIADIPDALRPASNDTSLCVAHAPLSACEILAFELEQYFWVLECGVPVRPRYPDVGQDIKVFVRREGAEVDVTVCVPLLAQHIPSQAHYDNRIGSIEAELTAFANATPAAQRYRLTVRVNPAPGGAVRTYLLSIGSCVDCGEEGVVGRGNPLMGVISACRPHTKEAPYGKNPVYHVGKVHGYMTRKIALALYERLGVSSTVYAATKNSGPLIPPDRLFVATQSEVSNSEIEAVVDDELGVDYLAELLTIPLVR